MNHEVDRFQLASHVVVACLGVSLVLATGQFVGDLWELDQVRADLPVCEDEGGTAEKDAASPAGTEEKERGGDGDSYVPVAEGNTDWEYPDDGSKERYDLDAVSPGQ